MAAEVSCQCGQRFAAQPHLYGKQVACPVCSRTLTIPAPSPQPVKVTCACGQSFKANASLAGTRTACPACGRPLDIPVAPTPSADPLFSDDLNDLMSQSMTAPTMVSQPTTLSPPTSYTQGGDVTDGLRSALKRISLGMSSLGVAIVGWLVYFVLLLSLSNTTKAEYHANDSISTTVGITVLFLLALGLTGLILGSVSVKTDARDRILAYVGIMLNFVLILLFVSCGVFSSMFTLK